MESIRVALLLGWRVRGRSAVTLADSEPEPDLAVVRGEPRDYLEHHPRQADIALIVEVANSSLDEDRDLKYRVYARAGISNYWIINLIDNRVEVYSDPSGAVAEPSYRARADFVVGQSVLLSVGSGPSVSIPVRDLIP
jgi:Uma2 family endonuclease